MGYKHLNIDERESILKMLSEQKNLTHIADLLGRNKGTISRELSRNLSSTSEYKPHLAQRYYNKRRQASKQPYRLEKDSKLRQYIRKKLKRYWSPEQIAGRLKRDSKIDVSPVTIYNWIREIKLKTAGFTSFYARVTANGVSVMAVVTSVDKFRIAVRLISVQRLLMSENVSATGSRIRLSARAEAATLPAM